MKRNYIVPQTEIVLVEQKLFMQTTSDTIDYGGGTNRFDAKNRSFDDYNPFDVESPSLFGEDNTTDR